MNNYREIMFRGKRLNIGPCAVSTSKEWICGAYVPEAINTYIHSFSKMVQVDPSTVGQFTGLADKNGKRIFEGDIVRFQFDNDDCPWPNKRTEKHIGRVFWQNFRANFSIAMGRAGSSSINDDLWKYVQNGNRVEVIGNIYDNPELLEIPL